MRGFGFQNFVFAFTLNDICFFLFQEVKPVKNESPSSKGTVTPNAVPQQPSSKPVSVPPTGPVTEDEIRAVLLQNGPVTTQDLVAKFKLRLKTKEVLNIVFL